MRERQEQGRGYPRRHADPDDIAAEHRNGQSLPDLWDQGVLGDRARAALTVKKILPR
jgi:hypothetical protein